VPTFPNARYLFTREEFDFWRSEAGRPGLARTGDYIEDSVLPVVEADLEVAQAAAEAAAGSNNIYGLEYN